MPIKKIAGLSALALIFAVTSANALTLEEVKE